jgi:hypothetical protein
MVMGFGWLNMSRLAMCGDLAKEPQCPGLVAMFLTATGAPQSTLGELERVLQMANLEVGFAQSEHIRAASHGRWHFFPYLHLIEQLQSLGAPPRQRICQRQAGGDPWDEKRDMCGVALGKNVFEHRDGASELPLAQGQIAELMLRSDRSGEVPRSVSNPDCLPAAGNPLAKISHFYQTVYQPRVAPHRGQHHDPKALVALLALKGCQSLPEEVHSPPIVPQAEVNGTQVAKHHSLVDPIPTDGGQGQGALATGDRVIIITYTPERVRHEGNSLPQPPLVAQRLGKLFSLAQEVETLLELSQPYERTLQIAEEIDALCERVTFLREVS